MICRQIRHRAFILAWRSRLPALRSNILKHALSPATLFLTAFQAVTPDGQQCEWSVHASPDGSLRDLSTGREYPYLFWEADSAGGRVSRILGLDHTKSFCVAGDAAGTIYSSR